MHRLKNGYITLVRMLRRPAQRLGLLAALERQQTRRIARWGRSLFAIYDIDDMVAIDLPWWCLKAVARVDAFLAARPDARVFEYGSGASSVWLARRAATLVSVEHDLAWHQVVAAQLANYANARLILAPPEAHPHPEQGRYGSRKAGWRDQTFHDYVHAIDREQGPFDLIVIDGRSRPACLEAAARRLKPDGLIVFDNSGRSHYQQAIRNSGLQHRHYRGLTACLPYPDTTSLLRVGRSGGGAE
ncbi:class I SAM-dependent methyltransferase [Candidatus Thiodictyon syntrophicum]|jgi:predicted O-methyltransferase YrrM|uniref:SAM-dependent methyltransferase n=1 Tax=Candidatus Thiodictyon syntrophicum TaxID=1166950 RepID=A0A2K8U585_9GAMM|nr:class I SAM-dependent methyltransferase [Candidatus Thiodictyon syntrophicum]AUB80753.1 hypothetical protein THSYN_07170 [Candidatus Thiodictyon syntrophicum]